ncbi:cobalamin B12-binding domain-containing protein [Mesobacillus subterraneus]|uniref:Cobalamin-binding protein n=1 Tax=Mesobacillus subterraneus TaxID=285983 RepID=A0A427TMD6_9BACI|nr:B12-binding domain-containing protein [Mesobacillus subterraneus]RSD25516.1 cobalamin-binding protein [Mesobacillus subterraneus]
MEKAIELAQLLLQGNQDAAWHLIDEERVSGSDSLHIYENILTKAMTHIGYLWETNKITVADEHLATSTCDFLLAQYFWHKKREDRTSNHNRKAMFLCVEDEQHYLGIKMASQLFAEHGWQTRFHGPNLPLDYAKKAANEWKPEVICLSFSILYHAEHLSPYIKELEELPFRPQIIIGGRLVTRYEFRRYGSDRTVFFRSLNEVNDWLEHQPNGVRSNVGT